MRINAADTSLSRFIIRPENFAAQSSGNPFMSFNYGDSLALSSIGERLRCRGEAIARWDEKLTDAADDEYLQLMDKSISSVGSILEQMKSLTILAEDESLTDSDRMQLQTQMAGLQQRLGAETKRMSLRLAGKSEEEIAKTLGGSLEMQGMVGSLPNGQSSDMLERALARIESGEAWDIAERWEVTTALEDVTVLAADGRRLTFPPVDGDFTLPEEFDPETTLILRNEVITGGRFVQADDPKAPTVSELLKQNRTIILMDVKSAKEGTERLDREIEELSKMREEFARVRDEMRAEAKAEAGDAGMDEGRLDAMLGRIEQERLAREARIAEDIRVAGGGTPSGPDDDEKAKKVRVETPLGLMEYATDENGVTDYADPRLVAPEGKLGTLFAKLEALFKDKIGRRLCAPKASLNPG